MGPAFIFQISDLNKKFGQRELLKNINLAFYPGAKIGLLGRNGAGKSTLMKIMAGIDKEFDGEARLADGYTVGYLEQEPTARSGQDRVRERDGRRRPHAGHPAAVRGDQRPARRAARRRGDGEAARRAGDRAGRDRRQEPLGSRPAGGDRDGRDEPAPRRLGRDEPLRRRAAPRGPLQAAPREARPAPARRADEPPRRRERRLAGAAPRRVHRHRRGRHPRPLLPRQRRQVDPRGRPRPRHPLRGQLLVVAGAEEGPARARGEAGQRPPEDARQGARVDPDVAQGPAGQEQGPRGGLR